LKIEFPSVNCQRFVQPSVVVMPGFGIQSFCVA
jgi:hypothetical protein